MREESFLHMIGSQLGQAISIDNSEAYKDKLFGPRIRLLIPDLNKLPHTVAIPRLDGTGNMHYPLEYSGLPNQCGRCRARDHQVRNCPKKELQRRRETKQHPYKPAPQQNAPNPTPVDTATRRQMNELGGGGSKTGSQPTPPQSTTHKSAQEAEPPLREHTPEFMVASNVPATPETLGSNVPTLQANDENFPKLPAFKKGGVEKVTHTEEVQQNEAHTEATRFVWRPKPTGGECNQPQTPIGGGDKGKSVEAEQKTPVAQWKRQGYRSGRLAEDFWATVGVPNTPISVNKSLQVIPFLLKEATRKEAVEYLVDTRATTHKPIALVHIAEILAGIPWTEQRVKQHVVSEVAQALHKIFVFTSKSPNPLQKWKHGKWFATWEEDTEGEHTCTLHVSIKVQEAKLKPRRGQNLGWRKVPIHVLEKINAHITDTIVDGAEDAQHWQQMTRREASEGTTKSQTHPPGVTSHNRFSALLEEKLLNSDTPNDW